MFIANTIEPNALHVNFIPHITPPSTLVFLHVHPSLKQWEEGEDELQACALRVVSASTNMSRPLIVFSAYLQLALNIPP